MTGVLPVLDRMPVLSGRKKEMTRTMREELTKVRSSDGTETVISQLSAEETGAVQVEDPVFTPEELAAYADDYEENGGVCQELAALLQRKGTRPETVSKLLYEIAAHGGIAAFVDAL